MDNYKIVRGIYNGFMVIEGGVLVALAAFGTVVIVYFSAAGNLSSHPFTEANLSGFNELANILGKWYVLGLVQVETLALFTWLALGIVKIIFEGSGITALELWTRFNEKLQRKRSGVGVYILIFIFAMIMFSFLWAIFGYEVFPLYQSFQVTTFPSGVYIPGQLNFMGQMVVWFPLVILWSGGLYLWSNAQNKSGGSDFPGQ